MKLLVVLILALPCIMSANDTCGAAEAAGRGTFLRCGGWSCSVTVTQLKGIDSEDAWALGRTTRRDAEHDCRNAVGFPRCIAKLMAQPPVVIVANCEEGTTSFFGAQEYKLSSKAKAGELSHAEDPSFWEVEMTHRERYAAITWLLLLCPSNSRRWHVRHEAQ